MTCPRWLALAATILLHRGAFALALSLQLAGPAFAAADADARITRQVRDALFARPELAGDDISVQTRDGIVYLHGVVDTNVERVTVESIAHDTPGVKRVVNALELRNVVR